MPEDDVDAIYERSLQQAALIGLCDRQQRSDLAMQFVEQEICENPLEAAAAINNAASMIIDMDALEQLFEEQDHDFDRSQQLAPLFKAFYQDVIVSLATDLDGLKQRYDFPEMIFDHFIELTRASLVEDE